MTLLQSLLKGIKLFFLLCLAFHTQADLDAGGPPCTLCQDGSAITRPDAIIEFDGEQWTCFELWQSLWLLGVPADCPRCTALQFTGYAQCGCPTFEDDNYCSLCPNQFADLPDPNITIPGFGGEVTCGDIVFAQRDDELAPVPCDELNRYTKLCQCPEACTFCRYSDELPKNLDRFIPYLTQPQGDDKDPVVVTCEEEANQASALFRGTESCQAYQEPPVEVNLEGYCGCPKLSPPNLCPLCPNGETLRDPNMVIANVGGLTCGELQEYLSYVTDEESCLDISSRSQACCRPLDNCHICKEGSAYGVGSAKVYETYNLGCDQIGDAVHFGFPLTCETAQERFPYFCRCTGVRNECTICPLNQVPPEPSRFIPGLNITCGEANDLASLSTNSSECAYTKTNFKIDVGGFCGCGQNANLFGRCGFCPQGQVFRYRNAETSSNIFGSPSVTISTDGTNGKTFYPYKFGSPLISGRALDLPTAEFFGTPVDPDLSQEQRCRDLQAIAPYVIDGDFCKMVQESIPDCCVSEFTLAPTISPQPSLEPTVTPMPTLEPTLMGTNGSFWDNFTDFNRTNETLLPIPIPIPTLPSTPSPTTDESGALRIRTNSRLVVLLSSAASLIAASFG